MAEFSITNKTVHTTPTITANGKITATRISDTSPTVHVSGTVTYQLNSSSYYGLPPACDALGTNPDYGGYTMWVNQNGTQIGRTYRGFYAGSKYIAKGGWFAASQNSDNSWSSVKGGSFQITLNTNVEDFTSGSISIYCGCIWEDNGTCDISSSYENVLLGSFSIGDVPYNPHQAPSISLSLPTNVGQWTKQGSETSIRCVWNRNGDSHQHNIYLSRAGSQIYNVNSDANNDDFTVTYTTPTNRDTTYEVYGKITDNSDGNYWAEARYTRGVWGLPTISVSVANPNKIVAGNTNKITVTTGKLNSDTGSPTTIWIEVNGTKVKEWTEQSTGSTHTLTYDYTPTVDGTTYNVVAKVRHRLFWRRK